MLFYTNHTRRESKFDVRRFTCKKSVQLMAFAVTATGCTCISSTALPKPSSLAWTMTVPTPCGKDNARQKYYILVQDALYSAICNLTRFPSLPLVEMPTILRETLQHDIVLLLDREVPRLRVELILHVFRYRGVVAKGPQVEQFDLRQNSCAASRQVRDPQSQIRLREVET